MASLILGNVRARPVRSAPSVFDGSLQELFDGFIEPNLPIAEDVEGLHLQLLEYCRQPHPVFVVRYVTGVERRSVYTTVNGDRLKPSDNAPAWWMHFVAFNGIRDVELAEMPTHMFDIRLPAGINAAGWHVAHILNAKDGNTDWQSWSREELARRFIRNVHPCNCFYIPKPGWRRYGSHPGVIAFFADLYAQRYTAVWKGFLDAAGSVQPAAASAPRYAYAARTSSLAMRRSDKAVAASYRYSRLCFKVDVIEPLSMEATFKVITPDGTFHMTKADFYRDFPNVVQGNSYRINRIYHYAKTPERALKYRI